MDRVARFETHWAYISRRWYRRDSTRDLSEGRVRRRRRRKACTISGTETFPAISCRASFYRRPMLFERNPVVPPFRITGGRRKRKLVVPHKFIAKRLLRRFIYTPPPGWSSRNEATYSSRMVGCVIAAPSIVRETTRSGFEEKLEMELVIGCS